MTFEEKVKSMKASEIIMAMVEALTHPPIININMSTFGRCQITTKRVFFGLFSKKKKICFGCAATNTICQISGLTFHDERIENLEGRAQFIKTDKNFLTEFEQAIDSLRDCSVRGYNNHAVFAAFATIKFRMNSGYLLGLSSNYTNENLVIFKELAEIQRLYEDGKDPQDTEKFARIC